MPEVYDKLRSLYPVQTKLKARRDGDFLIVMNDKHEIFYMNDIAAFIYERMIGAVSVDEIFNAVIDEYDLGGDMHETVRTDLVNTIRDLQWQRVIELKRTRRESCDV